ncbi:9905_t:CDS:10 [Paraglomus brasilianum]|uniref:Putative lipoate-protein ligase A n=1 Tax=Paraglomus brasilianum TaxID=144538 RepID=A0A9N9G5X4_9GLOM|nr:9905_t:CDS:10 [Paraglomus brasilianum]
MRQHPVRFSAAFGQFTKRQLSYSRYIYSETNTQNTKFQTYISQITDPWTNLAIEEWLFRHSDPDTIILYLWRNKPCIVIGRNQNPWKECNTKVARALNIPIIRRRSGGGTVIHDLGNTNYSLITPRNLFARKTNAEIVASALRKDGIPAHVTERHDIAGYKLLVKVKSSTTEQARSQQSLGSAFKLIHSRAYHHGTMLISSNLEMLKQCLKVSHKGILSTKGVESVTSPVININKINPYVTHERFCEIMLKEFSGVYSSDKQVVPTHLQEDFLAPQTWDWTYGQTPEFTYEVSKSFDWARLKTFIKSRSGIVISITISSDHTRHDNVIRAFEDALEGRAYSPKSVQNCTVDIANEFLGENENMKVISDLGEWLADVIE